VTRVVFNPKPFLSETIMTPRDITLVQESLPGILAIADEAAVLFYERLFAIDPTTRSLFARTNMPEQRAKLMGAIAMVVRSLDRPEVILSNVRPLGRNHAGYGVEPRHYDSVGDALLWTLEQGLGDAFTPELKRAWASAYKMLCNAMIPAPAFA
jgi:nitric oxide dioxygenase